MRPRFAGLLAAAGILLTSTVAAADRPPIAADHHVHVHAPAILDYLPAYCASPGRMGACDPAFLRPLTTADLLADMDAAGVGRAVLASTAYLAESPMMVPPRPDAAELLRTANDFTVAQARAHPNRLIAFVGVNPVSETALPEIARWSDDPFAAGIKLHLTNSGVDLRDPDHAARLAAVFRAASRDRKAILIHMRTRAPDYGARDVRIFFDEVLPEARGVPVLIAHSGGWGGLDAPTWDALTAFAEALEREPGRGEGLYFDLAQVFDAETSDADLARLVVLMRRIGVDRFVVGSDWPFSGPLDGYLNGVYARLPLTEVEALSLRRNTPFGSGDPLVARAR